MRRSREQLFQTPRRRGIVPGSRSERGGERPRLLVQGGSAVRRMGRRPREIGRRLIPGRLPGGESSVRAARALPRMGLRSSVSRRDEYPPGGGQCAWGENDARGVERPRYPGALAARRGRNGVPGRVILPAPRRTDHPHRSRGDEHRNLVGEGDRYGRVSGSSFGNASGARPSRGRLRLPPRGGASRRDPAGRGTARLLARRRRLSLARHRKTLQSS